ncbi:hypothetical protein HSR122_0850 [Halapricum desulfuricans]|uniref:Uncharacterized protein n=1 Tax=Halapricum desulfuricans TaxID=2841257 RepID=A0A897N6R6_9EURY|nr:hypothetical protein HSR122_0850 [Halapricum desulfuricans]
MSPLVETPDALPEVTVKNQEPSDNPAEWKKVCQSCQRHSIYFIDCFDNKVRRESYIVVGDYDPVRRRRFHAFVSSDIQPLVTADKYLRLYWNRLQRHY